MYRYHLTR